MSLPLPKLSELLRNSPTMMLEDTVESTLQSLGLPVPPGPTKMLARIAESIEAGRLPELPAPFSASGSLREGTVTQVSSEKTVTTQTGVGSSVFREFV